MVTPFLCSPAGTADSATIRATHISVLVSLLWHGPRRTDPAISRIYYFEYCTAGFATKTLGDVIITAGRGGAMELMEADPL